MTIVLDTPEQINMWVLLSRRSQLKLHMKGIKIPGIVKACKRDVPGCENARTAKDCIIPLEFAIQSNGGPADFSWVNVHIMQSLANGLFRDMGIFPDMTEPEQHPLIVSLYSKGKLEIVLTTEDPRPANGEFFAPA